MLNAEDEKIIDNGKEIIKIATQSKDNQIVPI